MKWISIKDQFPTEKVLIARINGGFLIAKLSEDKELWETSDCCGCFDGVRDTDFWISLNKIPTGMRQKDKE